MRGRSACRPIPPAAQPTGLNFSGSIASVGNGSALSGTGLAFASGGKPPDHGGAQNVVGRLAVRSPRRHNKLDSIFREGRVGREQLGGVRNWPGIRIEGQARMALS